MSHPGNPEHLPSLSIPGYYCDNGPMAVGNLTGYECPAGYYCPAGTKTSNQFPCPPATYNNLTKIDNATYCQPCPPGSYCQNYGLPKPEGLCFPGYVKKLEHFACDEFSLFFADEANL